MSSGSRPRASPAERQAQAELSRLIARHARAPLGKEAPMPRPDDAPILCDPSFQAAHARLERLATLASILPWGMAATHEPARLGKQRLFRFSRDPHRGRRARLEEW